MGAIKLACGLVKSEYQKSLPIWFLDQKSLSSVLAMGVLFGIILRVFLSLRWHKDIDYRNNTNCTYGCAAREHRYDVQCFQVLGTCTACSDQARPQRRFRLVFLRVIERNYDGEGRRIGVVILCHQSSDTRHFSWAEFVGLSENYVLKGISLASSHDLLKRSRENPPKILGRYSGRDNLTTQNSKEGCFYIADSRRLTLSAYSLLGGPTPASLTGFKA